MALNFPTNPTLGQIYIEGDRSFIWNGVSWLYKNEYLEIKTAIANAINEKGGSVTTATPFHMYPNAITELSGGGETLTPIGTEVSLKLREGSLVNKGDFINYDLEWVSEELNLVPNVNAQFIPYNSGQYKRQIKTVKLENDLFAIIQITDKNAEVTPSYDAVVRIIKIINNLPITQKEFYFANANISFYSTDNMFEVVYVGKLTAINSSTSLQETTYNIGMVAPTSDSKISIIPFVYNITTDTFQQSGTPVIIDSNQWNGHFSNIALKNSTITNGVLSVYGAIAIRNTNNTTVIRHLVFDCGIVEGQGALYVNTLNPLTLSDSNFVNKSTKFLGLEYNSLNNKFYLFNYHTGFTGLIVGIFTTTDGTSQNPYGAVTFVNTVTKALSEMENTLYNNPYQAAIYDGTNYLNVLLIGTFNDGVSSIFLKTIKFYSATELFDDQTILVENSDSYFSGSYNYDYIVESDGSIIFTSIRENNINVTKLLNNVSVTVKSKNKSSNAPILKLNNTYYFIGNNDDYQIQGDYNPFILPSKIYYSNDFFNLERVGFPFEVVNIDGKNIKLIRGIATSEVEEGSFDAVIREDII
jgi:hypothetical protein